MAHASTPSHPRRQLPVRPNLEQLRRQAKELLRRAKAGDPESLAEFQEQGAALRLTDAQLVLARSCGVSSWPRLVQACWTADALWEGDADRLREILLKHPQLIHEPVRGQPDNWGSPMAYAATLGRTDLVEMLAGLGASDLQHAFRRACLKGRLDTARRLQALGAELEPGMVMDPCETLNSDGLDFLLRLGAEPADTAGDRLAPVAQVLQTYSRNPPGKHRCLDLLVQAGVELPETPPMALHRGRRDLLEAHLARDPDLFQRTWSHDDIYPASLGCSEDPTYALHGTPLAGGTLLHLAVDFDEREILDWMTAAGADPNARAAVDPQGFGGHTALFGTVVSQPFRVGREGSEQSAQRLLATGARLDLRADLRKSLRFVEDESEHVYRDVTAREWGERFHDQAWVNPAALRLIAEVGG